MENLANKLLDKILDKPHNSLLKKYPWCEYQMNREGTSSITYHDIPFDPYNNTSHTHNYLKKYKALEIWTPYTRKRKCCLHVYVCATDTYIRIYHIFRILTLVPDSKRIVTSSLLDSWISPFIQANSGSSTQTWDPTTKLTLSACIQKNHQCFYHLWACKQIGETLLPHYK